MLGQPGTKREPCLLMELTTRDRGYAQGYRFRVDQKDGDKHHFASRQRSLCPALRLLGTWHEVPGTRSTPIPPRNNQVGT